MQNLYLSFSVVFPLICLLGLGYGMALIKMHDQKFFEQVNTLSFEIFLPALLFINIYQSNFDISRYLYLISFAVGTVFVLYALLVFIIPLFIPRRMDCGVVIQGIFRANIVLYGIPVASSLFGNEGVSTIAILIAFLVPLFNLIAVLTLQIYSDKKPNLKSVIKVLSKNPLVIASFLGFVFAGFEIKLPNMIESTLRSLAAIVTPLALIALGGTFKFREIKKYKKHLIVTVVGKLFVVPAIFIPLSLLFHFTPVEFVALMAVFVCPTALASYTMAHNMGSNGELAGEIVVLTSVFAILSIFIWLTLLQFLHLI